MDQEQTRAAQLLLRIIFIKGTEAEYAENLSLFKHHVANYHNKESSKLFIDVAMAKYENCYGRTPDLEVFCDLKLLKKNSRQIAEQFSCTIEICIGW